MEEKDEVVKEDISEESTTVLTADMLNNDKSEESTTVLTADMLKEDAEKAASAVEQQKDKAIDSLQENPKQNASPIGAPQGMEAPQNQRPQGMMPQGIAPQGMAPQGMAPQGMAPQGMAPQGAVPQGAQQKPAKAQKPPKQPKEPKEKKGKLGGGVIAYIVISIILILGMAGVGVWGYLHYNKKIDALKAEKEQLEIDKADLTDDYEAQLDDKDGDIEDYKSQIADLESSNSDLQAQIDGYAESVGAYSAYDSLINFFNTTAIGQGSSEIFVSDTVLHISGSDVKQIKVFCPSEDGVDFEVDAANPGVVSCEWTGEWEIFGDLELVATLSVTPVSSGSTTITIKDATTGKAVNVFVTVD
ncbi:MAG: hypothetical protein IJ763_03335 [Lachnospiraceae bacterium]|nr:hypothetical protein [Lachnospiraceae bacterium]